MTNPLFREKYEWFALHEWKAPTPSCSGKPSKKNCCKLWTMAAAKKINEDTALAPVLSEWKNME